MSILEQVVNFLEKDYFNTLTRLSLDVIYEGSAGEEYVLNRMPQYLENYPVAQGNEIEQDSIFGLGFDQIMAISEEAVNIMLYAVWRETRASQTENPLARYAVQNFSASFGAPIVRFLTNNRAVIWFALKEGVLHLPKYVDLNYLIP